MSLPDVDVVRKPWKCPECDEPLEREDHPVFGPFLMCKRCGLGIGCDENGKPDEIYHSYMREKETHG